MMRSILCAVSTAVLAVVAMNCSTSTNVNVNTATNRASNTLGNAANTVGGAYNSAANAISNAASSVTGTSDTAFANEAATGGMAEVELGKLASTKAASPDVKKFGQMMVTDHTKINTEFKALAAKKNWSLPSDLDSSSKSTLDSLKSRTGADFDKDYVEEMVDDHEKDVKAFEDKAKNATDPDLKAFVEKSLPTLQKHLDAIKAIQAKMNNAPANKPANKK
jgi:putative membrane protein